MTEKIQFEINGIRHPAEIRLVIIDRSKTYKLKPEDLPERQVIQFEWKKYELTQFAIRNNSREAYDLTKNKQKLKMQQQKKLQKQK